MMHHHGADDSCHDGPGGMFYCKQCERDRDYLDDEPEDPPVPGGPPMREGNNPRTGIAYNE